MKATYIVNEYNGRHDLQLYEQFFRRHSKCNQSVTHSQNSFRN